MKQTAKLISAVLSFVTILSISIALVFSAFASDIPTLQLTSTQKNDSELTVSISITEGTVNSLDLSFDTTGLTCTQITAGKDIDSEKTLFVANPSSPAESNKIALASKSGVSDGEIAVVVFTINSEEFSFTVEATNCSYLNENGEEIYVTPVVSGSVTSDDFTTTHTHNEITETVPAGCTTPGYTRCYCDDCGETIYNNPVSPTGHTPGRWEEIKKPEVGVTGTKVLHCAVCDEVIDSASVDALPPAVYRVAIDDISINYKHSATVTPTVTADTGAVYSVTYTSSDSGIATISENGEVFGAGRGTTTITCTVTDNNGNTVTDTFDVSVSFTWWQWIIKILLFGWIWY